jgi:(heptosyl)LPS beta-1,4-glucosyltransferase
MMDKISIVINTLNEGENLVKALDSVEGFADDVVVVDMKSDDESAKIASKKGARVYEHQRERYVELARNFGISKAKGDWVLILDPDERLTPSLKSILRSEAVDGGYDYFRIPRKNIIFGKWIKNSRWWPDYNIRFFRKGCVTWSEVIHSVPETRGRGKDLDANEDNAIVHYHYNSISQFLQRMDRYTLAQAEDLLRNGYKFGWGDILTKPANEFLSRFFFAGGYRDGLHGLALSLLQSFSELVVYLKVWELGGFEQKELFLPTVVSRMRQIERDFHYWQADSLYKQRPSLVQLIKRRFRLP